jgi:cytochrome c
VGPNLRGVVGRELASAPGYAYSEALRARGGHWSAAELDAFLASPARRVPGTTMAFGGIADPAERAALIELLSKLR